MDIRRKVISTGLGRIYEHRVKARIAFISAFRSKLTKSENKTEDTKLRESLKSCYKENKIGYITLSGMYKENIYKHARLETSYLVYTLDNHFNLRDFVIELGTQFEQGAIAYADKDGEYELICTTNQAEFDGKIGSVGEVMAKFKAEVWGLVGDFKLEVWGKIRNRMFNWDGMYEPKSASEDTLWAMSIANQSNWEWADEKYAAMSPWTRYAIRHFTGKATMRNTGKWNLDRI